MPMRDDFVTGAEFARWMAEEGAFRERLERRMGEQHATTSAALLRIEDLQREANGRTAKHGEAIAVIERRLEAIESEDHEIEKTVQSIRDEGCSQYAAHVQVMNELNGEARSGPEGWSRRKKAAAIGGIGLAGALVYMVIEKTLDLAIAIASRHGVS